MPENLNKKPHVITPEVVERGNRLLAEAFQAQVDAETLQASAHDLGRLAREGFVGAANKRTEAASVLLGVDPAIDGRY